MNCILTTHVEYRGNTIPVCDLKVNSNIKVQVECKHGVRWVKWSRVNQLCHKCAAEAGLYNTQKPGRVISWGNKISAAKRGKLLSQAHKDALHQARIKKTCDRQGISLDEFDGFPTSGVQYKLRLFMMNSINKHIFKSSVDQQDDLFTDILGYSAADLKKHLEDQFADGMSWDNYGKDGWEIDHIVPESWFKYDSINDESFQQAWALSNLQPMWAHQNRKKNAVYSGKYKEKKIFMLAGQSGAGKSTIAEQVKDQFTIVDKDKIKAKEADQIIRNNWHNDKPILFVVSTHVSTLYKKYSKDYIVDMILILESPDVIVQRIKSRGGSRISNVDNRYRRMVSVSSKYACFTGTADEVLVYLHNINQ